MDSIEDNEYDFSPPPAGKYDFGIVEAGTVANSKGTGKIFKARAKIIDGEQKGKSLFINLNVQHDSVEAQKIGRGQFKSLCIACGLTGFVENSSELLGKHFKASTKIETTAQWGEQAKISYFIPKETAGVKLREQANGERKAVGLPEKKEEVPFDTDDIPF